MWPQLVAPNVLALARRAKERAVALVQTHLTHANETTHKGDTVANLLAAASDATDEVFNIASGTETSLIELAEALQRVMGGDQGLEFGPPRGVNGVTRRLADTSAAARRLGWKAEIGLDEGLSRLVAWWRGQR